MVIERALAERALAERALPERALADAPPAIILVGHSLAGVLLPLAAARVPARRLVYLCAILHPALLPPGAPHPHPRGVFASLERSPDGSHRWVSPEACREALYGDCSEAAAAAAFARLRRQHTARRWADVPVPDPWPAVPVSSIVCAEDRAVSPEWGTWAARRRLHVEPIVLPGGHSPFLSRPEALARALDALARDDLDSADERIVETVDHP
jgi:pimeloyl-ACP methyl ester carboxylesterase